MRILHTESSLGWGGQEIRILDEARGLIARGHEVMLATPVQARIHDEAPKRGVPVAVAPIARKNLSGWLAMRRFIAAHRPEVINTHSSTDAWLAALACASLGNAPPIVRTRHISAPIPRNPATRWLYQRATSHIATTGTALRDQLIRGNGFDPARIVSVPTGIDAERFRPGDRMARRRELQLPTEATIVGIVATLRSWKGHRFLIEALGRIDDPQVLLVIVGDGPMRQVLAQDIDKPGLRDRVRMVGQHDDVLPWLQAFDLFALPSYANEGVPQALVQAMLCALPCVTTDIGAIGEAARDDQTALIVPPQDAAALAAALRRLIGDRDLRQRLGAAARAGCEARFSYRGMLDAMENIFRAAIAAAAAR